MFKPLRKGVVTLYNCGPTVYDYIHIGNVRSYLLGDLLRRYLEFHKYKVKQVINITDVGHLTEDEIEAGEDKIQKRAREKKVTPTQIARFYEKDFLMQIKNLNFEKAFKYPRASEHISEMQALIKRLIAKKHAYVANGSVYYDISTFKKYGELSGNNIAALEEGAGGRVCKNIDKRHFYDFALWVHDPKHLMNWKSPWGEGYPGWHLECSAMSIKYLGKSIDIHTGGEDNTFPHHEAEIAQSEGATGKKFVNYWLHTRHLLVNGKKMAKRDGNFYTPQDIYKKGYTPQQLRFFLLSTHYRKPLNFTFKALDASNKALDRLMEFENELLEVRTSKKSAIDIGKNLSAIRVKFIVAINHDLNTSGALGAIFDYIRRINKLLNENKLSKADARKILKQFYIFNQVFGLVKTPKKPISKAIKSLLESREQARNKKQWDKADKLRSKIYKLGYEVRDTENGPKVTEWLQK